MFVQYLLLLSCPCVGGGFRQFLPLQALAPDQSPVSAQHERTTTLTLLLHLQPQRHYTTPHGPNPGPNAYDLVRPEVTSPKRRDPAYSFGKADRAAMPSLTQDQHRSDPSFGTMRDTPGAVYDPVTPGSPLSTRFGTAPQRYSPEKGGNQGGPFLSK